MSYGSDIFARQQVYLEGVKNNENDNFDGLEETIVALLLVLLAKYGYENLGDMPKARLRELIGEMNAKLKSVFAGFTDLTVERLRAVMEADATVTAAIFARIVDFEDSDFSGVTEDPDKLWSAIKNDVVPGTGEFMLAMLATYLYSINEQIRLLLWRGYAEGWTPEEFLRQLRGTKANAFKDGLMLRLRNQFNAFTDTAIQHISSFIGQTTGQLFFEYYEWLSILDSRTTDICLSRDGRVYRYGEGPVPPAHYRCRSRIRPVLAPSNVGSPQTFYAFLVAQPSAVQNDIVGRVQADALRNGDLGASDFPRFSSSRRLTPEQYVGKIPTLLT